MEIRVAPDSFMALKNSGVTESGLTSNVISAPSNNSKRSRILVITRANSWAGINDGVPPPKKIVGTSALPTVAWASSISRIAASM